MEELLVFALLLYEEIVAEEEYEKRLHELFLGSPENDDLLYLEWETDLEKAIVYIRTHVAYNSLDYELFGKILMSRLKAHYANCTDLESFANKMYLLWKSLPRNIQNDEPFFILCYADEPLSWGDEQQTRAIYEHMFDYYALRGQENAP